MKKKILMLCMAVMVMFAGGCVTIDPNFNAGTSDLTTTEEEVVTVDEVETEEVAEETTEEATPEVTEPEVVEEEIPEDDGYYGYKELLDNMYDALHMDPYSVGIEEDYYGLGICETAVYCDTVEKRLQSIAFGFQDVNADGAEELLIMENVEEFGEPKMILAMYTIVDGKCVKVLESAARFRTYLLDDNKLYYEGSSGAAYSNSEIHELPAGSTEIIPLEMYFTYPKDETGNDCAYYYNADGIYDVAVSTEISAEEYQAFRNACFSRIVKLDVTTFESYKK